MISLPRWLFALAIFLVFPIALYLNSSSLKLVIAQDAEPEFKHTAIFTNASLTQIACVPSDLGLDEKYCVYSSQTFWHSRGLSMFTSPSTQSYLLSLRDFTDPTRHLAPRKSLPSINAPSPSSEYPFYIAPLPGKGMSVLASTVILPGVEILTEHPVLVAKAIPVEYFRKDTADLWPMLNQTMLDSLPAGAQKEVKALAANVGGPDFASSVLATNTFLVEINGVNHIALFPMISRLNHDCRPK
jgi:hypothetical protein